MRNQSLLNHNTEQIEGIQVYTEDRKLNPSEILKTLLTTIKNMRNELESKNSVINTFNCSKNKTLELHGRINILNDKIKNLTKINATLSILNLT